MSTTKDGKEDSESEKKRRLSKTSERFINNFVDSDTSDFTIFGNNSDEPFNVSQYVMQATSMIFFTKCNPTGCESKYVLDIPDHIVSEFLNTWHIKSGLDNDEALLNTSFLSDLMPLYFKFGMHNLLRKCENRINSKYVYSDVITLICTDPNFDYLMYCVYNYMLMYEDEYKSIKGSVFVDAFEYYPDIPIKCHRFLAYDQRQRLNNTNKSIFGRDKVPIIKYKPKDDVYIPTKSRVFGASKADKSNSLTFGTLAKRQKV